MLVLSLLAVLTAFSGVEAICRWVCPDTIGGSPLQIEGLSTNGASTCDWFGNGLGLRFASFDSVIICV